MAKETWRLIETGFHDAYFNMAVDEVLLIKKEKDKIPSTLRFYGWKPAAFSLGYNQNLLEEINFGILQNLGLDCVTRLTGGGIIFHEQEVTYSLAIGQDSSLFSNSVGESFRRLCLGIIKTLELLGFKANFARDCSFLSLDNSNGFCFAATSAYDIIVNPVRSKSPQATAPLMAGTSNGVKNKKLGGNAQRRKKRVIFQHGSIPLELNLEPVLLALKNFSGRERTTTSLRELLNKPLSFAEALLLLKTGFQEGLHIELEPGELSQEEVKMAQEIAGEKRDKFRSLSSN